MTKAIKIYKNSKMFSYVVMIEISDKLVNEVVHKDDIVELYHQEQLVGLNIFDPTLFASYPDGFIYPETDVLKTLNTYLKANDVEVSFNYNKHEYLQVAEVLEVEKLADSDHLSLCKVLVSNQEYSMICGADNVRVGMKTIAALDNALLNDGTKVIAGEVLGVYSQGMLCSLKELGLDPKKTKKGIVDLNDDEVVGTSFFDVDWRKYDV